MHIVQKKARALNKPRFGCLSRLHAINVTTGCEFRCVYCYARGYPGTPKEDVIIYSNLPQRLEEELKSPRISRNVSWVIFGTASDSFQTDPQILDITYECMRILLDNNKGVSFLTKGWIPDRFIDLFSSYPHLVKPKIGIVSLTESYRSIFEPKTATIEERLDNLKRLKNSGITPELRVDPVVPFITDTDDEIYNLLKVVAPYVNKVTVSYLHLRPMIYEQLRKELPPKLFKLINSCFPDMEWISVGSSTKTRLIPPIIRERGYNRFKRISEVFGMSVSVCACKNPDVRSEICGDFKNIVHKERNQKQLMLFNLSG